MTPVEIVGAFVALFGGGGLVQLLRLRVQSRVDRATARKADAEADSVVVQTARELVADLRTEMDRKVTGLEREVGRVRGHLEATAAERDRALQREAEVKRENQGLRERIERLETRVRELLGRLAAAPTSDVQVTTTTTVAPADVDPV